MRCVCKTKRNKKSAELLEIFSSNDIPLDEFGTGIDGDKKTKSNLFIIIPDDDDTFNFVPGMVYTLLFQELYRQARFFGGKLPMDVGFWLDEMANIKMPNNFDICHFIQPEADIHRLLAG